MEQAWLAVIGGMVVGSGLLYLMRVRPLQKELEEEKRLGQTLQEGYRQLQLQQVETQVRAQEASRRAEEKMLFLEQRWTDLFKRISTDALQQSNHSFLELARSNFEKLQVGAKGELEQRQQAIAALVKPVKESLEKFEGRVQELEKARMGAYEGLKEQVRHLLEAQHRWQVETAQLSRALHSPNVRGRWGEIQLRRVVELAGMLDHCDFYEQESRLSEEGRLRPDMLVRLPGNKQILIDAKAPCEAFMEAMAITEEEKRKEKLCDHARHVRAHMTALSKKSYWEQFQPTPEFVILFLPGETFFSAALEGDPHLLEAGVEQGVILAAPTTLIALLRAVAYGWRQENLSHHAQRISDMGKELYKRLSDMTTHWAKLGRNLAVAVQTYNRAIGAFESRVLTSARRFEEFEGEALPELSPLEQHPRPLKNADSYSTDST